MANAGTRRAIWPCATQPVVFIAWAGSTTRIKVFGYRVELEEIDAHLRIVSGADVVGSVAWPLIDGMASGIVSFVGESTIGADRIIDLLKPGFPRTCSPAGLFF